MSNGDGPQSFEELNSLYAQTLGSVEQSIDETQAAVEAAGGEAQSFDELNALYASAPPPAVGGMPPPTTLGTSFRFGAGVARGATEPLRFLGVPERLEGEDLGTAGLVGEFVGFGVPLVALSGAAGAGLKAIGLAQRAPRASRILQEAIAFGGFEAGGEEDPEERVKAALRGGAIGAAAGAVMAGLAAKHRGSFDDAFGVDIDPAIVSLEIGLIPDLGVKADVEIATALAKRLAEEGVTLQEVAAKFAKSVRGGATIVPSAPKEVKRIQDAVRKVWPEVQTKEYKANKGMSEVLFADAEGAPRERLIAELEAVGVPPEAITRLREKSVFLAEGKPHNVEEMIRIIRSVEPLEIGGPTAPRVLEPNTTLTRRGSIASAEYRPFGIGDATIQPPSPPLLPETEKVAELILPKRSKLAKQPSTPVHEYGHTLESMLIYQNSPTTEQALTSLDITWWLDILTPEQLFKMAGIRGPTAFTTREAAAEAASNTIRAKLTPLVLDVLQRRWGISRDLARRTIGESRANTTREQFTSLLEELLIHPQKVRRDLPEVFEVMAEVIKNNSPKMTAMLSKNVQVVDRILSYNTRGVGPKRLFANIKRPVGKKELTEFGQTGYFKGLVVQVGGREMEFLRSTTKVKVKGVEKEVGLKVAGQPAIEVRDLTFGHKRIYRASQVHKPTFATQIADRAALEGKVKVALNRPLESIIIKFRDPATGGVRKAALDLTGFERYNGDLNKWLSRFSRPGEFISKGKESQSLKFGKVLQVLEARQKKGLILNDDGAIRVFSAEDVSWLHTNRVLIDPEQSVRGLVPIAKRAEADFLSGPGPLVKGHLPLEWEDRVGSLIDIPFRDMAESVALQEGAIQRDIPFIVNLIEKEMGSRWRAIADESVQRAYRPASSPIPLRIGGDDIGNTARSVNLRAEVTPDGAYYVSSPEGERLVKVATREEAEELISRYGVNENAEFVDAIAVPPNAFSGGGAIRPPRPGEQMEPETLLEPFVGVKDRIHRVGKVAKSGQVAPGSKVLFSIFSAMEEIALAAQQAGLGPAFSKVFDPLQVITRNIDRKYVNFAYNILGGRTFEQHTKVLENLTRAVGSIERAELASQANKVLSKGEVEEAFTHLLGRPMNKTELAMADVFGRAGQADNIPQFYANSVSLRKAIRAKETTLEGYLEQSGLSENGKDAFRAVFESLEDPSKANIVAVYRHATAPELKTGFKTGREAFMAENNFSKAERKLSDEIEVAYRAIYEAEGMNAKAEVAGFIPALEGMSKKASTAILDDPAIRKVFPESHRWFSQGVKTGEIKLYSNDPIRGPWKHWRNIEMRRDFDPAAKIAKEVIDKELDPTLGKIMREYINELSGRPHETFDRVQKTIERAAKAVGMDVDENFTREIIDNLTYLVYGATIPFRPALIARNYFQVWQMVAPRTGHAAFMRGVKEASTKKGIKEAIDALALTRATPPLEFAERMGQARIDRMPLALRRLIDRGFAYYRSADDWGRAVAYHAQKARIKEHLGQYQAGKMTTEEFMGRSKMLTHSPVIQEEFLRLLGGGKPSIEAALGIELKVGQSGIEGAVDFAGRMLANQAIFRYGNANHPAGWGSIYGRLFGQFGTWPVQYKDFLLNGLTFGRTQDKVEFLMTHAGINAAVLAGGTGLGLNMMSWVSFPSLQYTGGPLVDTFMDVANVISGSPQEQRMAKTNLLRQVPFIEFDQGGIGLTADPRSVFVPMSYAAGDVVNAFAGGFDEQSVYEAAGLKFLRPKDDTMFDNLWGR